MRALHFCIFRDHAPRKDMTLGIYLTTASICIFAATALEGANAAMMWSLVPLSGALIASGMAYAFNPITEVRKIVLGRLILALLTGVGAPRAALLIHPEIKEWAIFQDIIMLVVFGAASGVVGYVSAPAVMRKAFNVVPGAVEDVIDSQVKRFTQSVIKETVDEMKKSDQDSSSDKS